jgi:hypothetical protein
MGQVFSNVDEVEDLSVSSLEDGELAHSLEVIGRSDVCKVLDISYAKLGPKSHMALCKLLASNRSVTKLDAPSRGQYAVGASMERLDSFCRALARTHTLRYLNLEGQNLCASVGTVGKSLKAAGLRVLDLSSNTLGFDPAFGSLCDGLKGLRELHTLLLASNALEPGHLDKLRGVVLMCPNLRRLDISSNQDLKVSAAFFDAISEQGGLYLLKCDSIASDASSSVQKCEALKQLISANSLAAPFAMKSAWISGCNHLHSIDDGVFVKKTSFAMEVYASLPHLSSLTVWGLENDYPDYWTSGFRALSKFCIRSSKIETQGFRAFADSCALGLRRLLTLEVARACDGFWNMCAKSIPTLQSLTVRGNLARSLAQNDRLVEIPCLRKLVVTEPPLDSREEGIIALIQSVRGMPNLRRFALLHDHATESLKSIALSTPIAHLESFVMTFTNGEPMPFHPIPPALVGRSVAHPNEVINLSCKILRAARQLLLARKPWLMPREIRVRILYMMDPGQLVDVEAVIQFASDRTTLSRSVCFDDFRLLVSGADTSVFHAWDKSKFSVLH